MELSIAVIKNNDILFPTLSTNLCNKQNDQIINLLEKCVEIKKIQFDHKNEIIYKMANLMNQKEKIDVGTTKIIYDNLNYSYQLCYIDSDKTERGDYNMMSMYLCRVNNDSEIKIRGNCVLLKVDVNNNKLVNLTMDDMLDVFLQHYVHTCIEIDCNGKLDEIKFIFNPLEWMPSEQRGKYKIYNIELFDKKILIAYNETEKQINERATKFIKFEKINGPCYVVLSNDEKFLSIDKSFYAKLEYVLANRDKLTPNDFIYDNEIGSSTKKIYNFDMFINDKYERIIELSK